MMLNCSSLQEMAHSLSLVEECDVVRSGALRLSTPFLYPDGSHIDVFVEADDSLFESYVLSDFGQTGLFLSDAQVRLDSTDRRKQIVQDICSELDVIFKNGMFQIGIRGENKGDISNAILRLAQACVRISDFAFHQRLRSANPFRDDVEDFFEASGLRYFPDVKVMGPYGRDVKVDFEVEHSYVLILAAMNEAAAHPASIEIFAKWHDLRIAGKEKEHKFVTIYNSASSAIRDVDIQRLGDYSQAISYPEQSEHLLEVLRGKLPA